MTYATTFSGVGGWEIGLNACGWELKWQCENNEWCRRLLTERFGVPIYRDIRTICDESPPPVDALIGSPPCQPFSYAGARRGASDERHLYPAFIKLVRQLKPRWVLMEQVPAIFSNDDGRAFGQYIGGLAALRYCIVWHRIPACAVGAPHERDRVWIMAHLGHSAGTGERREQCQIPAKESSGLCLAASDAHSLGSPNNQGGARFSEAARLRTLDQVGGQIRISDQWQTEPGLVRVVHGIPGKSHRVIGLGNAVVPQIPFLIGQAINQTLSQPLNQSEK